MATATENEQVDKSGERVRGMFGSIARRYDFLNHFLSLNRDQAWRRRAARLLRPAPGELVLDCCTGTADLALAHDRECHGQNPIVATDFCREMLEIGLVKSERAGASKRLILVEGDTQRLPLPSDTFSVVTVAFGLRNVADTARGLDEMIRVARPGGRLGILEFSRPRTRVLGKLYLAFFRHVLPRVGQAIAPNAYQAYAYLPASVLAFPEGEAMLELLRARGLEDVREHRLTLGVATLYIGRKPAAWRRREADHG